MKILVVQSIPYVLELVKEYLLKTFPHLNDVMIFSGGFEESLTLVANRCQNEELVVITSDSFHDEDQKGFTPSGRWAEGEKNSNLLAREIKKINSLAKVYAFSTFEPDQVDFLEGAFRKTQDGDHTIEEIEKIFIHLNLHVAGVEQKSGYCIKIHEISKTDIILICRMLGLTFKNFELDNLSLRIYYERDGVAPVRSYLLIDASGEIFIANYSKDDEIVNTVPIVLYLQSRNLLL